MAHIKKKTIKITSRNSVVQRCGDCLHFKMCAKFEKPCSQLGIKSFASAPQCFAPNVYALVSKSPEVLMQLGLLVHNFTPMEKRVLQSILLQDKVFSKSYGLNFGQPVFFKLGQDYLSNYFKGYVVGVASAGDQQVFVTSTLKGAQNLKPVIASLSRDSVFSVTAFAKKKASLIEAKRIQDPKPLKTPAPVKIKDAETHTPPSMEKAPAEWYASFGARLNSGRKLKRNKKDNSLEFKVNV